MPHAHDQGQRDGHGNGEQAPGALRKRLHHHQPKHRQEDRHDGENADHRDKSDQRIDFFLQHLTHGFAAATNGTEHHNRIMDAAAQRRANQDPQHPRQVAKLGRQHRPHQRSRPGNGGEVMTENHPAVGGNEVLAIPVSHGRWSTLVVQHEHLGHQPLAVEPVGHREGAKAGRHNPQGVDGLAFLKG